MKRGLILFLSCFLLAGSAYAAPIIDFADTPFAAVNGKTYQTVNIGDFGLSFSTNGGNLSWNPGLNGQDVDGIGITDDEVSLRELLTIEFSSNVYLSKIYITDLFYEGSPAYNEIGQYRLFVGGNWTFWESGQFMAPNTNVPFPNTNGELEISIPPTLISAIEFKTVSPQANDFSVRGLDIAAAPVPEPATLLLFGTGLIGLAGLGRKRLVKK